MSNLVLSPSITAPMNRQPTPESPRIIVLKLKVGSNHAGRMAPVFGPLGISPKQMTERVSQLAKALNWCPKHITVRFIIKSRTEIDLELAENSSGLIISNLGEAPSTNQHQVVHDGNITFDQVINIAQTKKPSKTARTLTAKVKEVLGTCTSIGCKVNGEDPRVVLQQISNGTCPYKIPEPVHD